MIDQVRQHLEQLRELTSQLNSHSDDANRVAMAVETFLSDTCNVGVEGSAFIDGYGDEHGPQWESRLEYGRYADGQFRLFISNVDHNDRDPDTGNPPEDQILWSNCSRDTRLKAYEKLPQLLAELVMKVEARVEKVRMSTAAINNILEYIPSPDVKKGGKR